MKKVVYNACYGGFGVSRDAMVLLLMLGFPLEKSPLSGSGYTLQDFPLEGPDGIRAHTQFSTVLQGDFIYSMPDAYDTNGMALRSHPALVKAVEILGSKQASGFCARLEVEELPDNVLYRISEYDGMEGVELLSQDNYTSGYPYEEVPLPESFQLRGQQPLLT